MPGLQEFAENFWLVGGPLVRDLGLLLPTHTTAAGLAWVMCG
jgi:hypothetical protein